MPMPPPRITSSGSSSGARVAAWRARSGRPRPRHADGGGVGPAGGGENRLGRARRAMPSVRACSTIPAAAVESSSIPRRRWARSWGSPGPIGRYATSPAAPPAPRYRRPSITMPGRRRFPPTGTRSPTPRPPVGPLAERGEVDVVLEAEVGAELRAERLDQPLAPPAGQVGRHAAAAPLRDRARRDCRRRMRHLPPADAGLAGKAVGDLADLLDQRAALRDAAALVAAGDDPAGDVGDRPHARRAADIDPDHPAGLRVELVEDRAGPLAARSRGRPPDQARRHSPLGPATRSAWKGRSRARSRHGSHPGRAPARAWPYAR